MNFYDLDPEVQQRQAFARLTRYLRDYVQPYHPYLRKRYREAGIALGDIRTLEDFRRLPILEKDDLRNDPQSFVLRPKAPGGPPFPEGMETDPLPRTTLARYAAQALLNRPPDHSFLVRKGGLKDRAPPSRPSRVAAGALPRLGRVDGRADAGELHVVRPAPRRGGDGVAGHRPQGAQARVRALRLDRAQAGALPRGSARGVLRCRADQGAGRIAELRDVRRRGDPDRPPDRALRARRILDAGRHPVLPRVLAAASARAAARRQGRQAHLAAAGRARRRTRERVVT